jgi:hypothetical protein
MSNIIKLVQPKEIDMINGNDSELLERLANFSLSAFDDNKLIENLQNDIGGELISNLYFCVMATFKRARAFNELKQTTIH